MKLFDREKFAFGSYSPLLGCLTGLLCIESVTESEAREGIKELLRSGKYKRS